MFDSLPDMAAKRAELTPEGTAFIDFEADRTWSFRAVDNAVSRFVSGLAGLGLKPGDRLAVLTLNRVEFFIALFACQRSGIIMAPLNWRQPVTELSEVLASVGASAVLFDTPNADAALALARKMALRTISIDPQITADTSFPAILDAPVKPQQSRAHATNPWYLLFTSGTTGMPKAVIQTARMCWANALNVTQAIDLTSRDRSVNYLPLFHTAGINLYTLPIFLFGGMSTVLPKFEVDDLFTLMRNGSVTRFFGVPAIYQALSLHEGVDEVDWSRLRCGCGGAPLPETQIRFFAERGLNICNGYGMTETGPTAFLNDEAAAASKIGSVGKAQMLTEARLDGVTNGEPGEGEMLLRGPAITPGYFDNPEATEKAFDQDGWLRTGDIAKRDEDGYYFIVDRIKDMFISGGENVYPAEVERVLDGHPDILEAAVVGKPDDKWGEVGAAFLIARPGHEIDIGPLAAWCRERLAAYKVPKSFHVHEDFPRTAAGKVRKPLLREQL
jgi:fatty-acyl-CoA synthase